MRINVSILLRDFRRVRQAALSGEKVTITTREGNLLLVAEPVDSDTLFGALKEQIVQTADDLDGPTLPEEEWLAKE